MLLGVIKRKVIDQHDIIYFEFPINVLTKFESTQRRHWFTNFNNPTPELNGCSIVQGPKEKSSNRYRMAYSS